MAPLVTFLSRLVEDPPTTGEAVPTMISRQVIQEYVNLLFAPTLPPAQTKDLGSLCLEKLRARLSSFEEQFSTVCSKPAPELGLVRANAEAPRQKRWCERVRSFTKNIPANDRCLLSHLTHRLTGGH